MSESEHLGNLVRDLSGESGEVMITGAFAIAKVTKSSDGERKTKYPVVKDSFEGFFRLRWRESNNYRVRGEDERFECSFEGEGDWYVGEDLDGKKCLKINCPEEGEKAEARIYFCSLKRS